MSDSLDYNNTLNLNDSLVQHTLAVRIGRVLDDNSNDNPLRFMRDSTTDWQDTTPAAIQRVTVSAQEGGKFTKRYHSSNSRKMLPGDRPLDWHNTVQIGLYDYTFSPREFNAPEGFEIPSDFAEGVISITQQSRVEHQLRTAMESFYNEACIIYASGRVGDSSQMAYQIFTDGETTHDAAGQDTARKGAPDFQLLNGDDGNYPLKQPTEIWTPGTSDFRATPVTHPSAISSDDKISFSFINRVKTRLTQMMNHRERGISWNAPTTMQLSEQTGSEGRYGNGTRMSMENYTKCTGVAIFDPDVMQTLRDDENWINMQQSMAGAIGTKSGQVTGVVGDINGLRIFEMMKMVKYKGGSDGSVNVCRGLVFGANSMMEILANYPMPDMRYRPNVREYARRIAKTPTNIQVRVGETNTGKKRSIFWSTNFNPQPVIWNYGNKPHNNGSHTYSEAGNIVALDVAI